MNLLMEMFMRDIGKMEREMGEEYTFGKVVRSIMVIGKMIE